MRINGHAPGRAPGAASTTGSAGCRSPQDTISTIINPWATTAARCCDDELAAWLADVRIVLADAAGDDPASVSTREIATLMYQAITRELMLRRRASASKPAPTGGLPREHYRRLREQIRERLDLVQLVMEVVPSLRRAGSSWRGVCPLHDDREPSLVLWPDRGRWRCFGCGAGGDAISWLLSTRRELDYRAAVTYAAMRAGLPAAAAVAWPSRRREGGRR